MAGGPSMRVYRAPWSTNCERVALALAHKGLEVVSVLIDYSNRAPVEAISGQALVPVLEDDGEVIADSVAIIRHLENRFPEPPLLVADAARQAEMDVLIEWYERVFKRPPNAIEAELAGPEPDRETIAAQEAAMLANLDLVERLLAGREYVLGDEFTAADCVFYPFLKYAAGRDPADDEAFHLLLDERQDLDERANLAAWIERIAARPRAFGP